MLYCPPCRQANGWPMGEGVGLGTCEACGEVHTNCRSRAYRHMGIGSAPTPDPAALKQLQLLALQVRNSNNCTSRAPRTPEHSYCDICSDDIKNAYHRYRNAGGTL